MQWGELELVNSSICKDNNMMINDYPGVLYFILEALIKQLIWAYTETGMLPGNWTGGNKSRLCTLPPRNCLLLSFSFYFCRPLSGAKLRFLVCDILQEQKGKQCACQPEASESFVTWAQIKATLQVRLLLGYTWVFLRVLESSAWPHHCVVHKACPAVK